MAEEIAGGLQSASLVDQPLCCRMTKCVGAPALLGDAKTVRAAANNHPYRATLQRPERGLQGQEQRPLRSRIRAHLEKIVH